MRWSVVDRYVAPTDFAAGCFVGRVFRPQPIAGPSVVVLRPDGVFDIARHAPTMVDIFDQDDPAAFVRHLTGDRVGSLEELLLNSDPTRRDPCRPWLLSPFDLQSIKAAGVTFAASLLERIVEEQARGDPAAAQAIRNTLAAEAGSDLSRVKPGSPDADRLRAALQARGLWSQYLEVGIGPDPEIFTKAQPMSSVGFGADIGLHPNSLWNNPEPEVVLAVCSRGRIVGASLGNDVNLRDFEGKSALLLGKAKDNNASAAIGPFIRLCDAGFGITDIEAADVALVVEGEDGFALTASSTMREISRSPAELVDAAMGPYHQYPDGMALYLGTLFAPTQDRGAAGSGFTHKEGDVVTVRSDRLGSLVNRVTWSDRAPPWTFGARALMENLSARGHLPAKALPATNQEFVGGAKTDR